jgi:hypothetical protein
MKYQTKRGMLERLKKLLLRSLIVIMVVSATTFLLSSGFKSSNRIITKSHAASKIQLKRRDGCDNSFESEENACGAGGGEQPSTTCDPTTTSCPPVGVTPTTCDPTTTSCPPVGVTPTTCDPTTTSCPPTTTGQPPVTTDPQPLPPPAIAEEPPLP